MKLGMQVGLGPGHIVLDGDPARVVVSVSTSRSRDGLETSRPAPTPIDPLPNFYYN